MPTLREQILDAMAAAFATINTAASPPGSTDPYLTDVTTVEQVLRGPRELGAGLLPIVGVAPHPEDDETFEPNPEGGCLIASMPVLVVAYVAGLEGADKTEKISNLRLDLIRAIYADETLGIDGVLWTEIVSAFSDEAAPKTTSAEGRLGVIVQVWQVRYQMVVRG